MKNYYLISQAWKQVYEGETEEEKKTPPAGEEKKTFTQDQVNAMLAEDRRKHKAGTEKTIQELETLKKSKSLTDKEKNDLQVRIEEMSSQLLTKEEMAEKEKKKLETEYTKAIEVEKNEKTHWKTEYQKSTIKRTIQDAAIKAEAFSPDQIVRLLANDTHLAEETKEDGTRFYTPRVKFEDSDKDGKPITLDLTVDEAVKRMKELPDTFGNLFKSSLGGGLGGSGGSGRTNGQGPDFKNMTPEQYKEWRKKNPKLEVGRR